MVNFYLETKDFAVWLAVAVIVAFQASGNMGVECIPCTLPAFWLPHKYRTICMAFLVFAGQLILFGWSFVFPYLLIKIENYTFLIFSMVMVINLGYAWNFVRLDEDMLAPRKRRSSSISSLRRISVWKMVTNPF